MAHPILYSFRRCPFAMRARLALKANFIKVELREIILRNKPAEMLATSPKGTVPVLILPDGQVLDESLDIMLWAMKQTSNDSAFDKITYPTDSMVSLIKEIDGPFKHNLDRYKYANRYEDTNATDHRTACIAVLQKLDDLLSTNKYLFSGNLTFADIAIAPFIRQFANTDIEWFNETSFHHLQVWLTDFCDSPYFTSIMMKYSPWKDDNNIIFFPNGK